MTDTNKDKLLDALNFAIGQAGLQASELRRTADWVFGFTLRADDRDQRWLKQQTDLLDERLATVSLPVLPAVMKDFRRKEALVQISYENPKILRFFNKNGMLEGYCRDICAAFEGGLIARRPKRKREELPHPELPPQHPLNQYERLTKAFKSDIAPDLVDRFNKYWKQSGKIKREIVEEALTKFLDENDPQ